MPPIGSCARISRNNRIIASNCPHVVPVMMLGNGQYVTTVATSVNLHCAACCCGPFDNIFIL